jgi:hypothetical protein
MQAYMVTLRELNAARAIMRRYAPAMSVLASSANLAQTTDRVAERDGK